ncbi:MAG TPA: hypothetical protein VIG43_00335 [Kurthia sp.]
MNNLQLEQLFSGQHPTPTEDQYIELSKSLNKKNRISLLKEGIQYFPFSSKIMKLLKEENVQPKMVRRYSKALICKKNKPTTHFFRQGAQYLLLNNDEVNAAKLMKIGLEKNKSNYSLLVASAENAMKLFDWSLAEDLYTQISLIKCTPELLYDIEVLRQLQGKESRMTETIEKIHTQFKGKYDTLFTDSYRKYTLFDNGKSRIELYKHIIPAKEVVATFDTIDKTWDLIPFAYNLIKKNQKDLVSLRRDHTRNFHQDISKEQYSEVTDTIFSQYDRKFAYGTSLGGYSSLYYGSNIEDVRILSMAPRNSAHPKYGSPNILVKEPFKHISPHPVNTNTQITIIYDPCNPNDENYISTQILPSYPNAQVLRIPYAGHRIPKFLSQTGQLRPTVKEFLGKKTITPIKRGDLRRNSMEYYWVMAERTLAHKHFSWSLQFAEHSISMDSNFDRPYATKTEALLGLNRVEEAIEHATLSNAMFGTQYKFAILLADCHEANGDIPTAIAVLEEFSQFKEVSKVRKMIKRLQEVAVVQ